MNNLREKKGISTFETYVLWLSLAISLTLISLRQIEINKKLDLIIENIEINKKLDLIIENNEKIIENGK